MDISAPKTWRWRLNRFQRVSPAGLLVLALADAGLGASAARPQGVSVRDPGGPRLNWQGLFADSARAPAGAYQPMRHLRGFWSLSENCAIVSPGKPGTVRSSRECTGGRCRQGD